MKKPIFFLVMLVISIGTATANASLINFDNLASSQDVGESYSSLGVHFTPGDFTILTQGQSLIPLWINPSFPNVALISNPPSGASIWFDSPQSTISFKWSFNPGPTFTVPGSISVGGPIFPQYWHTSISGGMAIFSASEASITSLTFNQASIGNTVIDDLVFSPMSGLERAKDRTIVDKIFIGAELASVGYTVYSLVAAIPTSGISTLGLLFEFIDMATTAYSIKSFNDPFDPNYSQKFSPVFRQLPSVPGDATLPQAVADEANAVLNHGSKAISFLQALNVSLDRLSSATLVGDQASIDLQRSAVDTYLALASSELDQYSRGLRVLSVELRTRGLDITITLAQINAFLDDLKARGFAALPQQEQAIFDLFGFDSAFRQSMIDQLLSVNPSDVPQSLVLALSMDATGMGDLSAVYAGPSAAVPEPSTMILIGSGLLGLAGYGRKKFFKK